MAMSKEERIARKHGHTKQERLQIENGVPNVSQMREGVPILRSTTEGVVEYIRYNGILHKNILESTLDPDPSPSDVVGFADDGYVKFGNGLIMQWGQETISATSEVVTFPISFPTACLNIVGTAYRAAQTGGLTNAIAIHTLPTRTGATFNTATVWDTLMWQAIGH